MDQFKKGQIVYVSEDGKTWVVSHFIDFVPSNERKYKTCNSYPCNNEYMWKYCLSVEDYHNTIYKPKDKDLVWSWDDKILCARTASFYDARNNCTFYPSTGNRKGYSYKNYEVIPRDQWPEWAIEAYEYLED